MSSRGEDEMQFWDLLNRTNQNKDLPFYCSDDLDADVSSEQQHYSQAKKFLFTARYDAGEDRPDGFDYLVLALIGKDMLTRSNKSEFATMMTGIILAFRSLTPFKVEDVDENYRTALNWSIYNKRNEMLMDWFHNRGIWALVDNNQSVNRQYNKIHSICQALEFRVDGPPRNEIYLLKLTNLSKHLPHHYILLINKYCFHLVNIGIFSGEYQRMKARLFGNITSFDKVGTTKMDVVSIDFTSRAMALQSHSLFFSNWRNFATKVFEVICEEKDVNVKLPSFCGVTIIIQLLLLAVLGLVLFIVLKLAY